jgi:hypothetical protein
MSPILPPGTQTGLWVAGVAAWVIQGVAAWARIRWGRKPERLLAVWAWSAGARLSAVGIAAFAVYRLESLHPVTTLVGLAGYLFAMMLLEPTLLRLDSSAQTDSR